MKYFHPLASSLVTACAVAGTLLASPAGAATLSISGQVLAGTCSLTVPPVTLAPLAANTLAAGDNGLVDFKLGFADCVGVKKAKLKFDGIAAEADAARWKNTAGKGAADGVSVSLLKDLTGDTYIKQGDTVDLAVAGATAELPLRAGYFYTKGAVLSSGAVASSITITADYE